MATEPAIEAIRRKMDQRTADSKARLAQQRLIAETQFGLQEIQAQRGTDIASSDVTMAENMLKAKREREAEAQKAETQGKPAPPPVPNVGTLGEGQTDQSQAGRPGGGLGLGPEGLQSGNLQTAVQPAGQGGGAGAPPGGAPGGAPGGDPNDPNFFATTREVPNNFGQFGNIIASLFDEFGGTSLSTRPETTLPSQYEMAVGRKRLEQVDQQLAIGELDKKKINQAMLLADKQDARAQNQDTREEQRLGFDRQRLGMEGQRLDLAKASDARSSALFPGELVGQTLRNQSLGLDMQLARNGDQRANRNLHLNEQRFAADQRQNALNNVKELSEYALRLSESGYSAFSTARLLNSVAAGDLQSALSGVASAAVDRKGPSEWAMREATMRATNVNTDRAALELETSRITGKLTKMQAESHIADFENIDRMLRRFNLTSLQPSQVRTTAELEQAIGNNIFRGVESMTSPAAIRGQMDTLVPEYLARTGNYLVWVDDPGSGKGLIDRVLGNKGPQVMVAVPHQDVDKIFATLDGRRGNAADVEEAIKEAKSRLGINVNRLENGDLQIPGGEAFYGSANSSAYNIMDLRKKFQGSLESAVGTEINASLTSGEPVNQSLELKKFSDTTLGRVFTPSSMLETLVRPSPGLRNTPDKGIQNILDLEKK